MICRNCNQELIITNNSSIECETCGFKVDFYWNDDLYNSLVYNKELEEAKELGKKEYVDGVLREANPYSLGSSEIMLNKKWEEGWNEERIGYEREAFSSSVEKLNLELEKLEKEIKYNEEVKKGYLSYISLLKQEFKDLSKKKYKLGKSYKKDIYLILEEIEKLEKSENPDN